ncbi:MAG: glutamine--fructose-6-phosphate transaminase (isomerizing) [Pirellulaceae bacterium]
MCGIVGYVGPRIAQDFLLEGLQRLEYRGYDSAGIATIAEEGSFEVHKSIGRIKSLSELVVKAPSSSGIGIGHTRWATHGAATIANAHPHRGGDNDLVLAHNGVIENYFELKTKLEKLGYQFESETDTEVVANLIVECLKKRRAKVSEEDRDDPQLAADSIKDAVTKLRGTYGLVVLFRDWPETIFAARLGSPLVVGVGDGEHFVASDASPLVGYTDRIVYLADHQVAVVNASSLEVSHRDQGVVDHDVQELQIDAGAVELEGYDHYMLKEIFEQPESLRNTIRGRLSDDDATSVLGGLRLTPHQLRRVNRIVLTACGTSWHSALVGEYMLEEIAQIPVEVEYASELRYRNPPMDENTLVFAITQSGETADTLAALREMKRKGHRTLAICNVVGSSIAQESEGGIYLHAGPEIGVASTKAYTSQCLALAMLALHFGRLRHMSYIDGRAMIEQIRSVPDVVEQALDTNLRVKEIAEKYKDCQNFLYLGRHFNFPTALEGALKLKEISYLHAEGYPAAEMKHGPIALVDEKTPSVFVMPKGFIYDKVMSNLEEIKARGGPVIAIAAEGDKRIESVADDVIYIPHIQEFLQPIISIIPLQLLAYHIAVMRGCDVDKPRNLAKSVTVE